MFHVKKKCYKLPQGYQLFWIEWNFSANVDIVSFIISNIIQSIFILSLINMPEGLDKMQNTADLILIYSARRMLILWTNCLVSLQVILQP